MARHLSRPPLITASAAVAYFGLIRRWHMHWGAREDEAHGPVIGDELMPDADVVSTRAIEIDAPPAAVWPWLVQMGPGRAGAYTYAWIERRLGVDIHNVDHIVPELQHLAVGDEIPMSGYTMQVQRLQTERGLVFRSSNLAWVWSFELRATDGHTRLISRNRFDASRMTTKDRLVYPLVEPGSWVMERKMLLTIKKLAERLARGSQEQLVDMPAR